MRKNFYPFIHGNSVGAWSGVSPWPSWPGWENQKSVSIWRKLVVRYGPEERTKFGTEILCGITNKFRSRSKYMMTSPKFAKWRPRRETGGKVTSRLFAGGIGRSYPLPPFQTHEDSRCCSLITVEKLNRLQLCDFRGNHWCVRALKANREF